MEQELFFLAHPNSISVLTLIEGTNELHYLANIMFWLIEKWSSLHFLSLSKLPRKDASCYTVPCFTRYSLHNLTQDNSSWIVYFWYSGLKITSRVTLVPFSFSCVVDVLETVNAFLCNWDLEPDTKWTPNPYQTLQKQRNDEIFPNTDIVASIPKIPV